MWEKRRNCKFQTQCAADKNKNMRHIDLQQDALKAAAANGFVEI